MKSNIEKLLNVMTSLRNPETGCPWDLEQNLSTLAPYLLEEAYEVVDAIEKQDMTNLKEELGDVLLQIVFQAQIASEKALFTFEDIAGGIADKMIERHPHVFSDLKAENSDAVVTHWEAMKEQKRQMKAKLEDRLPSVLDDVSVALPATSRAIKLQNRAARVGFDWNTLDEVFAKINEEISELKHEIAQKAAHDFLEDELGDVLFAVTNLARKLDIDPETALRRTNTKFERRFQGIEKALAAENKTVETATLGEMEKIWIEIKTAEKKSAMAKLT